jgi:Ulp1 family protease
MNEINKTHSSDVVVKLLSYMKDLYKIQKGSKIKMNEIQYKFVKVPQQPNTSDCGVYVLQYVERFFQVI